jgi:hypothetical protein
VDSQRRCHSLGSAKHEFDIVALSNVYRRQPYQVHKFDLQTCTTTVRYHPDPIYLRIPHLATDTRASFDRRLHLRISSASSKIAAMGWFGSSSKDDSGVKKTEGGAFESPSRSNRKQCYAARDAFFECLDKNNVLDSINTKSGRDKAASFCSSFDQEFEKNCAHSWVRQISQSPAAYFHARDRNGDYGATQASWDYRLDKEHTRILG